MASESTLKFFALFCTLLITNNLITVCVCYGFSSLQGAISNYFDKLREYLLKRLACSWQYWSETWFCTFNNDNVFLMK